MEVLIHQVLFVSLTCWLFLRTRRNLGRLLNRYYWNFQSFIYFVFNNHSAIASYFEPCILKKIRPKCTWFLYVMVFPTQSACFLNNKNDVSNAPHKNQIICSIAAYRHVKKCAEFLHEHEFFTFSSNILRFPSFLVIFLKQYVYSKIPTNAKNLINLNLMVPYYQIPNQ